MDCVKVEAKAERNKTLDFAKGIAIILMVIRHCYSKENFVLTLIYGFHMPLFFMISGIIYREKIYANEQYRFRVPKIVLRYMKPYYIYCVLFSAFVLALRVLGGRVDVLAECANYLWKIFSLQGISSLWYLPCLLLAELIFICVYRLRRILLLPVGICAYLIALLIPVDGILVVLWRSFIGLGFLVFGFYIPPTVEKIKEKVSISNSLVAFTGACVFVLYLIVALKNGMVTLVELRFNNSLLYSVSAVLGSILLLLLSWLVESNVRARWTENIAYLGRKTLFVLTIHLFLIEIIRLLDYKVSGGLLPKLGLLEGIVFGALVCAIICMLLMLREGIKQKRAATR